MYGVYAVQVLIPGLNPPQPYQFFIMSIDANFTVDVTTDDLGSSTTTCSILSSNFDVDPVLKLKGNKLTITTSERDVKAATVACVKVVSH
jgi:hypothetical protein